MTELVVIGEHGFSSLITAETAQEACSRVLAEYGETCGLTASNVVVVTYELFANWTTDNRLISSLYRKIKMARYMCDCDACRADLPEFCSKVPVGYFLVDDTSSQHEV